MTEPHILEYIAYYRVSTDRQGASGLGLDAQREAVRHFLGGRGALLAEYTEIESGRRHANRLQLLSALDDYRRRATGRTGALKMGASHWNGCVALEWVDCT